MSSPGLPVNRAAIKAALFSRGQAAVFSPTVNGASTWITTSRRLKPFTQVDPTKQPAMFLVQHREGYMTHGVGRLTRRYLDMGFWCYAPTGTESVVGDDLLDTIESALEAVLIPDNPITGELTLGGLAYWCRITREEGLFVRDPGDLDGQALLVLPVRILLP